MVQKSTLKRELHKFGKQSHNLQIQINQLQIIKNKLNYVELTNFQLYYHYSKILNFSRSTLKYFKFLLKKFTV